MTLSTGTKLAHYEISSLLGKGGMGEVYRAKDQKLGRVVAIKMLPEEFAKDAERVARFQREAKLLASLNHPNIASIYGLEEADGIHFLVLELIEGDTLADQIRKGPIPAEESLKLALQIAEALEAAHERGVIHRDLKPANIKVTPDGKVKVLDFGLAKAFAGDQGEMILSDSPTLSVAATQQGVILGTAAYMSPEQAKGKTVDRKTDIWAFGCVLFEMLTMQPAFKDDEVSEILASVIKGDTNLDLLPAKIHPRIRELLSRCLQKDMRRRYADIADARYEIEQTLADPGGVLVQPVPAGEARTGLQKILPWAAALVLGGLIVGVAVWNLRAPEPKRVMRFDYDLPEGQGAPSLLGHRSVAISPDGSQFVYVARQGLYLRSMNELSARLIAGNEDRPRNPFFSPDGQWIGYTSSVENKLKKILISGGAPISIADITGIYGYLSWCDNGTIVYAPDGGANIMRISANGGDPELLVEGKGKQLVAPQILPDGKTVMFTMAPAPLKIMLHSLETGEQKELIEGNTAQYLPTGHIVYVKDNSLFAIPFDLGRLETTGGPVPMIEGVFRGIAAPQYAVSDSGTLVYMPGRMMRDTTAPRRTLVWVDREGQVEEIGIRPNYYAEPGISPDGTRVALTVNTEDTSDIWIWDFVRETMARLTRNGNSRHPLWTPDGQRIVFLSDDEDKRGIYWTEAVGTGKDELLGSVSDGMLVPWSWSSDGKTLVTVIQPTGHSAGLIQGRGMMGQMRQMMGGRGERPKRPPGLERARSSEGSSTPEETTLSVDIGSLLMDGDREWKPLLQEDFMEDSPRISPDGRWMAYTSTESGRFEVYVRPFPDIDKDKKIVSTGVGFDPLWSPDSRELFYVSSGSLMAVEVNTDPTLKLGKPRALLDIEEIGTTTQLGFDISPDGRRFLMIKSAEDLEAESPGESTATGPHKINIVLNWFEELKERVPVE